MNPEKRAARIERAAVRSALETQRKRGAPLTRDDLLSLKVQAVPLWVRLLIIGLGLAGIGAGIYFATGDAVESGTALFFFGVFILVLGIVGRRRTLESLLETMGDGLAEGILRAILDALDGI